MKKLLILPIIALIVLISCIFLFKNSNNGYKEIEKAKIENNILLVDFWGEGCHPCKKLSPIIDEISEEYPDIEVVKVDINSEDGLHEKYNIRFIPTVIIFYEGSEFARLVGFHEKQEYINYIESLMNPSENVMMKVEFNKK